jgi:hypothetical protein
MECAAFTLVIAAPTQMELQAKLDRQRAFHYADKHPDLPL